MAHRLRGRISCLKRDYGWRRTRIDGIDGTQAWCGWGVLAHNATKISGLIEDARTGIATGDADERQPPGGPGKRVHREESCRRTRSMTPAPATRFTRHARTAHQRTGRAAEIEAWGRDRGCQALFMPKSL